MRESDVLVEIILPTSASADLAAAAKSLRETATQMGTGVRVVENNAEEVRCLTLKVGGREVVNPARESDDIPAWLLEAAVLRELKPRGLLFLCVANSARSQLGEGVARLLAPSAVRVQSAGSHPTGVRPEAAAVMAELGIDSSIHSSKNVAEIDPATVDTVITLCGEEECPLFLGKALRLHWGLSDPAAVQGDEETRLDAFRRIRDELRRRLSVVFS